VTTHSNSSGPSPSSKWTLQTLLAWISVIHLLCLAGMVLACYIGMNRRETRDIGMIASSERSNIVFFLTVLALYYGRIWLDRIQVRRAKTTMLPVCEWLSVFLVEALFYVYAAWTFIEIALYRNLTTTEFKGAPYTNSFLHQVFSIFPLMAFAVVLMELYSQSRMALAGTKKATKS
jgi:hypothetical protein